MTDLLDDAQKELGVTKPEDRRSNSLLIATILGVLGMGGANLGLDYYREPPDSRQVLDSVATLTAAVTKQATNVEEHIEYAEARMDDFMELLNALSINSAIYRRIDNYQRQLDSVIISIDNWDIRKTNVIARDEMTEEWNTAYLQERSRLVNRKRLIEQLIAEEERQLR